MHPKSDIFSPFCHIHFISVVLTEMSDAYNVFMTRLLEILNIFKSLPNTQWQTLKWSNMDGAKAHTF